MTIITKLGVWSIVAGFIAAAMTSCVGTTGRQVRASEPTTVTTPDTTIPEPDCAESLPPAAQAGQLVMIIVADASETREALTDGSAGGLALKGRQPKDIGDKIADATKNSPIPPFVASDEEGGTVQRLAAALGTLPSAAEVAEGTPAEAGVAMGDYASKMKNIGFNMVFGPVADVGSGSGLGSRSFGDDPDAVASYVTALVKAIEDAGLIAVVKHWPGIGGGTADPHDSLSALASIDDLRSKDMIPFRAAIDAGAGGVMVSHSIVPGLTGDDEPASLSKAAITGELRGAMDYKGLVITDALGMGAIMSTKQQDEASELAISAGADIALVSGIKATESTHSRLTDAIRSGRLAKDQVEQSVRRVLAAKGISGPCPDIVANSIRATGKSAGDSNRDGAGSPTGVDESESSPNTRNDDEP